LSTNDTLLKRIDALRLVVRDARGWAPLIRQEASAVLYDAYVALSAQLEPPPVVVQPRVSLETAQAFAESAKTLDAINKRTIERAERLALDDSAAIEAVKEWAAAYRSAGLDGTLAHKPGVVDAAVARVNAACDALFKLANVTSQINQDQE
jgi:hypothetical protein